MSEQGQARTDRGRSARGAFPRFKLKTVEELAGVVQEVGHGEPARLVSVLARLDRKVNSGATRSLLTSASRGYGLVSGSATDTHLALTERGTKLVSAASDYDRYVVAFEALQHNGVFQAFVDKFKHRPLPSDEVATDFIKGAFDLSEADAAAAVKVIKQNLNDYGLVETVGDREVVNPPDEVLESLRPTATPNVSPNGQAAPEPQEHQPSSAPTSILRSTTEAAGEIVPQIAFNIQIQLPTDASPDTYEAIFRNIATHLLRRNPE